MGSPPFLNNVKKNCKIGIAVHPLHCLCVNTTAIAYCAYTATGQEVYYAYRHNISFIYI